MHLTLLTIGLLCLAEYVYSNSISTVDRSNHPNGTDDELDLIVGGVKAAIGEFPYMVILRYKGAFRCGGSLISPDWILTAAHCVVDVSLFVVGPSPSPLQVTVNTISLSGESAAVTRGINEWPIVHPSYNPQTNQHDIALLSLKSEPIYGVRSVQLPTFSGNSYSYRLAAIAGWGRIYNGGPISQNLLKASVTVQENTVCRNQYGSNFYSTEMMCASAPGYGPCQGDSGGPLLVDGIQVGITSFGRGCADPNSAGVYTRITSYLNWIGDIQSRLA